MTTTLYEEWLLSQGLHPRTIDVYRGKIDRVNDLCAKQGWDLLSLTASQCVAIADSFPNSPSSRRQLRTAIQHYWDMHDHRGPIKAIRVPTAERGRFRGLDHDETVLLAKTASGWFPAGTAVLLGLYLALRRMEIAQIRWTDFDRDLDWVTIQGKGARVRTIPVHPKLTEELRPHMTAFPQVFPGHRGRGHIHPATIWLWVQEVSEQAGVRITRPHQLRHTSLAAMNDTTGDLRTTQTFAGHARPETTAIYTRTTSARLTSAMVESFDWLT